VTHIGKFFEKFTFWKADIDSGEAFPKPDRQPDAATGNMVGSVDPATANLRKGAERLHRPVLDIDFPVLALPSTNGGTHLFIDFPMSEAKYAKLLVALYEAGLYQKGCLDNFQKHRVSTVRLPWIVKPAGAPTSENSSA
jgi:hypothetical protein